MFVKIITSGELEIKTPAKINLYLDVLNKRQDGFHNINSLFQAVSIYDRLHFTDQTTPKLTLEINGNSDLPVDDENLIVKAYNFMRDKFDLPLGLHVLLDKQIPIAAGLAGGSDVGAPPVRIAEAQRRDHLFETRPLPLVRPAVRPSDCAPPCVTLLLDVPSPDRFLLCAIAAESLGIDLRQTADREVRMGFHHRDGKQITGRLAWLPM